MNKQSSESSSALAAYQQGKYIKARKELAALLGNGEHWPYTLLAQMLFEGLGGDIDVAAGIAVLQQALEADRTNTAAMLALAELYYQGRKVSKDIPEAVRWLFRARAQQDQRAMGVLKQWLEEEDAAEVRAYLQEMNISIGDET